MQTMDGRSEAGEHRPMTTPQANDHPPSMTGPLPSLSPRTCLMLALIPGLALVIHLVANALGGYGYFRDELYYLASTRHLEWGYVDHPPLSIWLLALARGLVGDSLFAVRLLPAFISAASVGVAMLMARELGGGRWAMALAGTAALISPINLAFGTTYSMNAFDVLVWAVAAYLLVRLIRTAKPRLWLWLGVVLGLGLLNKVSVLWLGTGIVVATVATPLRRWLATRWPWLGGLSAGAIFAPYVIWNAMHDWAHLEFMRNASASKYSGLDPIDFLGGQILVNHPFTLPLWLGGLAFLLFGGGRRFRALGLVFVTIVIILVLNGTSKPEYLVAAMTIVFAAGGAAVESWTRQVRWLRPAFLTLLLTGLVLVPLTVPLLPVDRYIAFAERLGIRPHTAEAKVLADLPQYYADMFGWQEKAEAVAAAYRNLAPGDREQVVLFGDNYGRAGALDLFGPKLGLPPAISSHNSYWLWGPGDGDADVVLSLGGDPEQLGALFESVEEVGRVRCRYCMPYENDLGIFLCRGSKMTAGDLWAGAKNYS